MSTQPVDRQGDNEAPEADAGSAPEEVAAGPVTVLIPAEGIAGFFGQTRRVSAESPEAADHWNGSIWNRQKGWS